MTKHSDLPHHDILDWVKRAFPQDVAAMLRRQFPTKLAKRLLFEVREWEDEPWCAVYIMERNELPNLVVTETEPSPPRIIQRTEIAWDIRALPHPRLTLGWRTSPLLDVYSSQLTDLPRRYKNQIIQRATLNEAHKGWVIMRL